MGDNTESSPHAAVVKTERGDPLQVPLPGRSSSITKRTSQHTPNRLPSLRGPRDLTLGGIKKKTFAPNIPVRKERVKSEVKEEVAPVSSKKSSRERHVKPERGRGRGRFKSKDIIQSHSIFESGPSMEARKKGGESFYSEPTVSAQRPTFKKESYDVALEKAESEAVMKKLDEGNSLILTDLQNDEKLKPVTLPMREFNPGQLSLKREPGVSVTRMTSSNCSHVFNEASEGKLVLFQLPDVLPGVPPSSGNDSMPIVKQEPGTDSAKDTSEKEASQHQDKKCTLDKLSEGRIGKIQVLRSGKCRLVLGNVSFDLKMGTPCCFGEELVSIRLPPEDSPDAIKGHMSVLGNIDHKVVCVPDMETLLNAT